MSEEDSIDIEQELDDLLTKVQPNLQDVIKRSFTNVVLQHTKNGEQTKPDLLEDTSYFAKNTQVNLSRLELVKSTNIPYAIIVIRSQINGTNIKMLPWGEGHVFITLTNMIADVSIGLILDDDDAYSYINPSIEFLHDEVIVKLSWPSPQKGGGYDFSTTEQIAKHIDDLPLTAAISLPLYSLLREKLKRHLALVLRQATSVSEVVCCNPSLFEAYGAMVSSLAENGNKIVDMVLINMRRTLLQNCREVLELPPLHATFLHKIGPISFVGRFETEAGWVKNLATVNRVSDVSVSRPDHVKTCFHFTLQIKDLQVGYDQYEVRAAGAACRGRVAARLGPATLLAALSVGLAHWEPYAQLHHLSLHSMPSMDLHVTGLGPLSALTPLVGAWARGASVAHAAPALTAQLRHDMQLALAELPLWGHAARQTRLTTPLATLPGGARLTAHTSFLSIVRLDSSFAASSQSRPLVTATLDACFWRVAGAEAWCTAGRPQVDGGPISWLATNERLPRQLAALPCWLATRWEGQVAIPGGVRASPQSPKQAFPSLWR
ncbi:hypothetical protein ACJJTC_004860 [Scirpophaga incertulas]